jgi:hypothetical protein
MAVEVTKTLTEQTEVAYTVTDGGYVFMDRFTYPTKTPLTAKAIDAKIAADYAAWRVIMDTPVPEPTKAELKAQLVRAQADKVAVEAKIATLTAAVAAAVEDVKVG